MEGSKFCKVEALPGTLIPCCKGLRLLNNPPLNSIAYVCQESAFLFLYYSFTYFI